MREALHWREWMAELGGTGLIIVGGLGAVPLDFGSHSPIAPLLPSHSLRLLLTGALFAGTGSLIAISPLGRISGAHINPAVSLAFWLSGKMHHHDVVLYMAAQCVGAFFRSDSAAAGMAGFRHRRLRRHAAGAVYVAVRCLVDRGGHDGWA